MEWGNYSMSRKIEVYNAYFGDCIVLKDYEELMTHFSPLEFMLPLHQRSVL